MPKPELKYRLIFLCLLVNWGSIVFQLFKPVTAQIVSDKTLSNNSVVNINNNVAEIMGGTARGDNLFHSFYQFSLNPEIPGSLIDTAFFNNPTDISRIISRVTGDSASNINGLIRANGTADLFLINPNGLVFGEDAALDIGGSFLGSTADSLQFADGGEFSATLPEATSLLTVSIPVGMQYGTEVGSISVQGKGNQLFTDFDTFTLDRGDRPEGLAVNSGKTLALVGGNVALAGGNLTASEGQIELGSVGANQTVTLATDELGWRTDYEGVERWQNISLREASSLEVSGNGSGNINLRGGILDVDGGSAILSDVLGDGTGGDIALEAAEINLQGTNPEQFFTSAIYANVDLGATGQGGNIQVNGGSLAVREGSQITVNTYGPGDAGNLFVSTSNIELNGVDLDSELFSGLFSQADLDDTGAGGDIAIETNRILVNDGAQISAGTFGNGDSGNVFIQANTVELIGESDFASSGIYAAVDGLGFAFPEGNGGNVVINTEQLSLADSAQISLSTNGAGNAGDLLVNADRLELTGISPAGLPFPTALVSTVAQDATGNGGQIELNVGDLLVADGAQIISGTEGLGDSGNVIINSQQLELVGSSELNASGIFSSATMGSGSGGNIAIATKNLQIQDGAMINSSNFPTENLLNLVTDAAPGTGSAGVVSITADTLTLDSFSEDTPAVITAANFAGGGGSINFNIASDLVLSNSQITAGTEGASDGGLIKINSENITLRDASVLDTNTSSSGNGGEINLTSTNLNLSDLSTISSSASASGQAGNIVISGANITSSQSQIVASSAQSGGGDIILASELIHLADQSLISTSVANGDGGGGNIDIRSESIVAASNSDIRANAEFGAGGNISIFSQILLTTLDSEIDASSQFGLDGIVDVTSIETERQLEVIDLPVKLSDPTKLITATCPVQKDNVMVIRGRGGLPENPLAHLRGQSVWQDLRLYLPGSFSRRAAENWQLMQRSKLSPQRRRSVVEAGSWMFNPRGQVQLVASSAPAREFWQFQVNCKEFSV